MTKGKILAIGAVAGAITMAIFGFGIYGMVSCGNREYWNRRIREAQNDELYESLVATVAFVERDKDMVLLVLNYDDGTHDATVIPEAQKYFQDNGFEFELNETYTFTIFRGGAPVLSKIVASVTSEDGKTVYLPYDDGKQMIVDYFISCKD